MFTALLDTNVLWPSLQRDFLLTLAAEGFYRPLWSEEILEELSASQIIRLRKLRPTGHPDDITDDVNRMLHTMRMEFDDAIVTGWEGLVGNYGLPDIRDEHVLAAADIGRAGALVTDNLRDFPRALVPASIDLVNAAQFCANNVETNPRLALHTLSKIAARYSKPRRSARELLLHLRDNNGMQDVYEMLGPLL